MSKEQPKEKQQRPHKHPWMPAPYDDADVYALRSLAAGTAEPHQQQRAIRWIVETLCGTYDMSYRPDSQRDTDFAEGRRFPGLQIVKLLKLPLTPIQERSKT